MNSDEHYIQQALAQAKKALSLNEVPIGAVIVQNNKIIGEGWNQAISTNDPTMHAEIMAIRNAAKLLSNYRLIDCDLYVTLQPCAMCLGAMKHARIRRVVFGAFDPKKQSSQPIHALEVDGGVLADKCGNLLTAFFRSKEQAE